MSSQDQPPPKDGAKAKTILVVEDDRTVREMLERALKVTYAVVTAKDGLEAAELLGKIPQPSLLVCDVMMPNVDGFSLVRLIRNKPELKHLPVLFLSAKAAPSAQVEGISLGAKHYMTKPFSVKELVAKVARIVGDG